MVSLNECPWGYVCIPSSTWGTLMLGLIVGIIVLFVFVMAEIAKDRQDGEE